MCVCVRACVRACVRRACVRRACVRAFVRSRVCVCVCVCDIVLKPAFLISFCLQTSNDYIYNTPTYVLSVEDSRLLSHQRI